MTKFEQLKLLFKADKVDDDVTKLFYYLKCNLCKENGTILLIVTPDKFVSKKVFQKLLSEFDFSDYQIARNIRLGGGYEFITHDNERIVIQDIDYLFYAMRDGIRFKKVYLMEEL